MKERDNITEDIYKYICKEMNYSDEFDVEMNIIERGIIDSLGILKLVTFLETKYSIEIALEDVNEDNFAKVGTIADFVKSKVAGQSEGLNGENMHDEVRFSRH